MALEVSAQEEALHVGVSEELDAKEVVDLTLKQVGSLPQVDDRRDDVVVAHLSGNGLHAGAVVCLGVLKDVDAAEAFLAEVLADDGDEVVEMLLLFQFAHALGETVECDDLAVYSHFASSLFSLSSSTKSSGTSVTTMGRFQPEVMAALERLSSRSSAVCLWLAPPKNFSIFTLR